MIVGTLAHGDVKSVPALTVVLGERIPCFPPFPTTDVGHVGTVTEAAVYTLTADPWINSPV